MSDSIVDAELPAAKPSIDRAEAIEHWLAKNLPFPRIWGDIQRRNLLDALAQFAEANMDPRSAIHGMYRRRNENNDVLRTIFRRINEPLSEGKPIATALVPYFSPAEVMLVQSGEASGKLAEGFNRAVFINEALAAMRSTLRAALIYPVFLLAVLAVLIITVSWQLLPMLAKIFPVASWPTMSRVLYSFGTLMREHGILMLAIVAVCVITSLFSLPRWKGRVRSFCDHWVPPWSIYREYQSSVVLIAVSAMTASSQSLEDSVADMMKSATPWLREHLNKIRLGLGEGWTAAKSLDTGLFDRALIGTFEDFEESGALLKVLARIGERAVNDANKRIAERAGALRHILFFVVGGFLLWTYSSVAFVMIELSKGINAIPQ